MSNRILLVITSLLIVISFGILSALLIYEVFDDPIAFHWSSPGARACAQAMPTATICTVYTERFGSIMFSLILSGPIYALAFSLSILSSLRIKKYARFFKVVMIALPIMMVLVHIVLPGYVLWINN